MPIKIRWYEPERIIFGEYSGHLTVDELSAALSESATLLDGAAQPVHFIVDFRQLEGLPMTQLTQVPNMGTFLRHPNLGWSAIIGTPTVVSFWLKVFIKLFGLRYATFNTPEEAEQFLREVDRIQAVSKAGE
jgi:hypothetical protein